MRTFRHQYFYLKIIDYLLSPVQKSYKQFFNLVEFEYSSTLFGISMSFFFE